jgi:hypothetical protein
MQANITVAEALAGELEAAGLSVLEPIQKPLSRRHHSCCVET